MYVCIFAYSKNGFEECKKKNVRQSNTIDFWMHLVKRKKAKERKQRRASVKKKKGKRCAPSVVLFLSRFRYGSSCSREENRKKKKLNKSFS